jgi:hypothetical protein
MSRHRPLLQTGSNAIWMAIGLPTNHSGGQRMRRREFIAGLGSAVAWPLAVRAQQADFFSTGLIRRRQFDRQRRCCSMTRLTGSTGCRSTGTRGERRVAN